MATQSTVTGKDIEQGLRKGEFVWINKPNYSSEIRKDDLRLVGRLAEGKTIPLFGWSACAHCHKNFQTHGNLDKQGKCKNFGLSSQQRHMEACVKRPQSPAQHSLPLNISMTEFVPVKRGLSKQFQEELKRAETRSIVGGQHRFLSVEQPGLLELAQTCIKIGSQFGADNVNEIWYGRKTVKETCVSQLAKKVLVIQASSGESERHFSSGGIIVSEKRSLLEPQTIEPLVVLHEAMSNNLWLKVTLFLFV